MNCPELFNNHEASDVLDGDSRETYNLPNNNKQVILHMPYLSGPDICKLCSYFGFTLYYDSGYTTDWSRWQYMNRLLKMGLNYNFINDIFNVLLDKSRFLEQYHEPEYNLVYKEIHIVSNISIIDAVMHINDVLYSSRYKLIERDMSFFLSSSEDKIFDSYLNYGKSQVVNENVSDNDKNMLNSYLKNAPVFNIINKNQSSINVNTYFNAQILNRNINDNFNRLYHGIDDASYKNDVNNAKNCMKHRKYREAVQFLKHILKYASNIKGLISSIKYIINVCKLFYL